MSSSWDGFPHSFENRRILGVGFDPHTKSVRVGLGLASMRERLRLLGGSVALHSRHMEGTEILVEVPLAQVNRAGAAPVTTTDRMRPPMKKARILLADDHVLVAEGLRTMLAPVYDVVGTVSSDGRSSLRGRRGLESRFDPGGHRHAQLNGLDATRVLKRLLPNVKVIVLTQNEDSLLVAEAFRAGASGYLLKYAAPKELLQAINEVLKGASYLSPRITSRAVAAMLRSSPISRMKPANSLRASAK